MMQSECRSGIQIFPIRFSPFQLFALTLAIVKAVQQINHPLQTRPITKQRIPSHFIKKKKLRFKFITGTPQQFNRRMSYLLAPYHSTLLHYTPYSYYAPTYYPYLYTPTLLSALRRSRMESQLRRSRVESDLRRSRLEAELAAARVEAETALRRSRVESELALNRIQTDNALRRSRLNYEIQKLAAETALRNSRVTSELIANQVESQVALRDSVRRLRQAEADSIIRRL